MGETKNWRIDPDMSPVGMEEHLGYIAEICDDARSPRTGSHDGRTITIGIVGRVEWLAHRVAELKQQAQSARRTALEEAAGIAEQAESFNREMASIQTEEADRAHHVTRANEAMEIGKSIRALIAGAGEGV